MELPDLLRLHREEVANSITHGIGLTLSSAGIAVLLVYAHLYGDIRHIVGCSVYGATLLFVYAASTLYHASRTPRLKFILRVLDHVGILFLIAGSCTPFCLVLLKGGRGWLLLGLVWGCALAGTLFKIFSTKRFQNITTLIYLAMGWMTVAFVLPALETFPTGALVWLVLGGISYTAGVIFFLWESLPYGHAIWHVFVLAGSIFHYFAVLLHVLPGK